MNYRVDCFRVILPCVSGWQVLFNNGIKRKMYIRESNAFARLTIKMMNCNQAHYCCLPNYCFDSAISLCCHSSCNWIRPYYSLIVITTMRALRMPSLFLHIWQINTKLRRVLLFFLLLAKMFTVHIILFPFFIGRLFSVWDWTSL